MIELPRAALTPTRLQSTPTSSASARTTSPRPHAGPEPRDDSSRFLPGYVRRQILASDPFQTIDVNGVGSLVSRGRLRRSIGQAA
ncbi:MAG: hypothetical protein R2710_26595 [Acidimicrobiales bacterium]